jgi:hypothetical protein
MIRLAIAFIGCVFAGLAFLTVIVDGWTISLWHWQFWLFVAIMVIGVVYITGEEIWRRLYKRLQSTAWRGRR